MSPTLPADPIGVPHASKFRLVTVPAATIKALVNHPLTDKGLAAFISDWAKTGQKIG